MQTKYKYILIVIWLLLASLGTFTVFANHTSSALFLNSISISNTIQRIFGLTAYALMFFQLILGSFMDFWRKYLGSFALKFHIFNGLVVYSLIFLHPLMWVVVNYFSTGKINPYFPFVDVCLLCQSWTDWIYNFGRIGFWFLTIGVTAGLLRGYNLFMRNNWRKFHILNYIAFILIYIHSLALGTDVGSLSFSVLHGPSIFIISAIILFKLSKYFRNRFEEN